MMRAAPIALTGLLTLIVVEVLKVVLAPVALWVIGILALGLKIGFGLIFFGIMLFVVQRVWRSWESRSR